MRLIACSNYWLKRWAETLQFIANIYCLFLNKKLNICLLTSTTVIWMMLASHLPKWHWFSGWFNQAYITIWVILQKGCYALHNRPNNPVPAGFFWSLLLLLHKFLLFTEFFGCNIWLDLDKFPDLHWHSRRGIVWGLISLFLHCPIEPPTSYLTMCRYKQWWDNKVLLWFGFVHSLIFLEMKFYACDLAIADSNIDMFHLISDRYKLIVNWDDKFWASFFIISHEHDYNFNFDFSYSVQRLNWMILSTLV